MASTQSLCKNSDDSLFNTIKDERIREIAKKTGI